MSELAEVYITQDILQIKPNAKILDVTAGNRHIWGKNKLREDVLFCDKEINLKVKPDVICKWDNLPWPDNYFHCIIFDPPHVTHFSETSIHLNPKEDGEVWGCWWGGFNSRGHMVREIHKAQKEFARVAPRLCLKWNDNGVTLEAILSLFLEWMPVWIQPYRSTRYQGNSSTYWVKMIRKSAYVSTQNLDRER